MVCKTMQPCCASTDQHQVGVQSTDLYTSVPEAVSCQKESTSPPHPSKENICTSGVMHELTSTTSAFSTCPNNYTCSWLCSDCQMHIIHVHLIECVCSSCFLSEIYFELQPFPTCFLAVITNTMHVSTPSHTSVKLVPVRLLPFRLLPFRLL